MKMRDIDTGVAKIMSGILDIVDTDRRLAVECKDVVRFLMSMDRDGDMPLTDLNEYLNHILDIQDAAIDTDTSWGEEQAKSFKAAVMSYIVQVLPDRY